eukprot:m.90389 g.90389  ORF g.90389 m.90389 type:complete len:224 (+) comp13691_c0_seq1:228-899(+)
MAAQVKSAAAGAAEEEMDSVDIIFFNPDGYKIKHPLHRPWTFWFDNPIAYGAKSQTNWRENLKKIYTVETVEDFWAVYNTISPASEIVEKASYHFFRNEVVPLWESPENKLGGKWSFVLPLSVTRDREKTSDVWLKLLLAVIGEQFEFGSEICGCVFQRRKDGDRILLWTANANNAEACIAIGRKMAEVNGLDKKYLPDYNYQRHDAAFKTGRSYTGASIYTL